MSRIIKVIETEDGSQSLLLSELNETYHSTHGAAKESQHVFIENGLASVIGKKISVFEVGFGTGLNALLALKYGLINNLDIQYTSIESHPLPSELTARYNQSWLSDSGLTSEYNAICESTWNEFVKINSRFHLKKISGDWLSFMTDSKYDVIFYDAFAPAKQHEMWEVALLEKSFEILANQGLLVTYCAQGQFRRNLESVGFEVERLPGPPGKREMIRARKPG
jgi:tRNA U34 5-methylaminomethyl-2-thiouridine-forming methyltransferase MnmC